MVSPSDDTYIYVCVLTKQRARVNPVYAGHAKATPAGIRSHCTLWGTREVVISGGTYCRYGNSNHGGNINFNVNVRMRILNRDFHGTCSGVGTREQCLHGNGHASNTSWHSARISPQYNYQALPGIPKTSSHLRGLLWLSNLRLTRRNCALSKFNLAPSRVL